MILFENYGRELFKDLFRGMILVLLLFKLRFPIKDDI